MSDKNMQDGLQAGFELFEGHRDDLKVLLPDWHKLATQQGNHYLLYQSPEWWEHLLSIGQGENGILFRMMQDDRLAGIVPLQRRQQLFRLLPGNFPLARVSLTYAEVLGGQPLMPADEAQVARLYESVFAQFANVQAIYFKSVPQTSEWYDLLIRAAGKTRGCFAHVAREETFHYLTLPATFEEFLQRFTKKKRYNLKRQLRLMEEAYQGKLGFECITTVDQVDAFLVASNTVASRSWKDDRLTRALVRNKTNQARYVDLANRGLLRAYVLRDDQRPVAYALGYQYGDTYHYSDISYAESESRLSPGTVLLFLIVRDLIGHSPLRQINFGITDADYKRQFADRHTRDRSIWIFRSTPGNRLISLVQDGVRKAAMFARFVRGRFAGGRDSAAAD